MFKFARERQISAYLPLVRHIGDGQSVLIEDGSLFAMVEVQGLPWETTDPEQVAERHARLNVTLRNIASESVIVSVYQCRGLADPTTYPAGRFRSAFAEDFDTAYRARLFDMTLYDNRLFIGIQVRPPRLAGEFVGERVARRQKPAEEAPEDRARRLRDICALLNVELAAYNPRRLGIAERRGMLFSEMAEAIVFAMTGKWRPIGLTTGRLGNAMFSERIIVGREAIEYRLPGASWYGAMFGMRQYPALTWPGMFANLLAASYQCTLFQSFRFVPTNTAQTIMRRKRTRMLAAEDPAESQALALKEAADQLGNAEWVFGSHSMSLLVFGQTPANLTNVATAAWSDLANAGAVIAREGAALEAALFSMVPGNLRFSPRPGYISSINLAAMAPLHAYPSGAVTGHWDRPVMLLRTIGGTPYRYHLHVGDVGNTFVCGRTGAGKSVFLASVIAQSERLGATTVLWDKDRGLKILTLALGGRYLELRNPTGLSPLKALTGSTEDIDFLVGLVRGLIAAGNEKPLTPEEDRRILLGLRTIMALPPEERSMSELRAFLGVDPNGAGARLEKWCRGNELGWVVDCPTDVVSLNAPVIGFDQTSILDNPMARGPVMATLYHYVEKLIDGRRLLFVIDEFWKSLLDPAFRGLVNDKLRTLRKLNSPMLLATQSPRDALVSSIAHTIRDQCPTQCYFGNAQASWDDFGEAGMGLSKAEWEIVRALPEGSGELLLKQGRHSVRVQLPLRGMDDELAILSGRENTTRLLDRIMLEAPDASEVQWISRFQAERKRQPESVS